MKMSYKLAITAAIFGLGLGTVNTAQALTVAVPTSNQGWWSTLFSNDNSNNNYITGNFSGNSYHNFFTFDLSGIAGVSSATLQIQRFDDRGSSTKTLGFFDVATSTNALSQKINNPNVDIYNDLGSGKNYGTFNVSTSNNSEEILNFTLNSDAIADINARSDKYFSVGGALLGNVGANEYLFGFSGGGTNPATARLVINADSVSVPEPLTVGGTAVAGVTGLWLKRKRKAS